MSQQRIGIGFDAWGGIARVHTMALRALPVIYPDLPFTAEPAAVATRNPEQNGDRIRRAGFRTVVSDYQALIADPAVDAVDICTPNSLHPAVAEAAWQAGKSVYCEKPIAESLASAQRMADAWAAASAGPDGAASAVKRSQVALMLRFWPAVARAKDAIEQGRLGRILTFRARMVHGGYLDPVARPYSWRLDKALSGGGALADLGVHMIDMVQFLLGAIGELDARTRTFVTERPTGLGGEMAKVAVDDWAEITCTVGSGAVGTIEATRVGDGQEETTLEIFGTEGSLKISNHGALIHPHWFDRRRGDLHVRGGEPEPGPYTRAVLSVWPPSKLSLGAHVDAHFASLHWWLHRLADPRWDATRPPVAAGIPEGLSAQEVLERAYAVSGRQK
jgi:predicted dehydrogenase